MNDDRLLHVALKDAAATRLAVIDAGSLAAVVEVFRFANEASCSRHCVEGVFTPGGFWFEA